MTGGGDRDYSVRRSDYSTNDKEDHRISPCAFLYCSSLINQLGSYLKID